MTDKPQDRQPADRQVKSIRAGAIAAGKPSYERDEENTVGKKGQADALRDKPHGRHGKASRTQE